MPSRYDVFYNGGIYHVFDRTIDGKRIFSPDLYEEFIDTFCYYRSELSSKLRYSLFKKLPQDIYKTSWKKIFYPNHFKVDILSFCLMPNHYHFLIKKIKEKGVIKFMSNIVNSITRYYNVKNERKGPLFLPQFRSKRIRSQTQLIYVSRYIHTNCYAHGVVRNPEDIFDYPYSSIKSYINLSNHLEISTDKIMSSYHYKVESYKKFILSNSEIRRRSRKSNIL